MPTDFPKRGDDKRVSLQSSEYPLFPLAEAQALKDEWPDIWDAGGNILGDKQFNRLAPMARDRRAPETPTEEEAVRLREAWAARHLGDFRLAGVIAQIKWLVVGSRGLDHMRQIVNSEKERLRGKSIMDAPLVMKDGKASFVMTSDALDRQGEVVETEGWDFGNFMKNPVILDSHRYESIDDIVGKAVGEPRRVGSGWQVDLEFAPTERGKTAQALVEAGMLNAVSVGFRSTQRRKVDGAMHHVQKELLEVSLVSIPANPEALRVKAAAPYADLPLASEAMSWDGPGARQRVQAFCGAKGADFSEMDWAKYAKAFLWVDPQNKEADQGYKLIFADVVDGELKAVPRGLMTCAAVLAGARGGVDIPAADRAGVVSVLSKYYDKMDREVPEGAKAMEEEGMPKPMGRKSHEQMMALRDNLIEAVAILDAMMSEMDGEEPMGEEPMAPEAPVEEAAKDGGAGQDTATTETLVEALNAALSAIGGI